MEKRRGWKPKEIQFIKDNYGVKPVSHMASELSRSYSSITHKIHKLGLDDPRQWTSGEDRTLIENYEYNPTVWELFPTRSRAAITQRATKTFTLQRQCGNYPVNWRFFDRECPDMAYVLGFIAADGCVEPHLNRVSISLAKGDVQILYDIRGALDCHNPLCYKNTRNEVALYVHNRHIVDMLQGWGIVAKKATRTVFPTLSANNEPHFVRGVFDGDGSIYVPSDNRSGRIQFLGSMNLLSHLRTRFIQQGCSSRPLPRKRKVNTHVLSYSSNRDLVTMYRYLYSGGGVMLERKYRKFKQVIADIISKEPSLEEKSLEELIQLKSVEPTSGQY